MKHDFFYNFQLKIVDFLRRLIFLQFQLKTGWKLDSANEFTQDLLCLKYWFWNVFLH